ncbi:flavin-binding monooxygenase-like family protein [Moniliophthora roreri MCA 2997]|uniref:L-ornithine N(5)-monooxygenase [NAD(P)H] n=1 Tax=Moniliophthora roreri (strain MCA 2997) TaxID=1381753 RepID=V2XV32_MONRO|nr:flavin-binding monooxygenase-like family protein [Moniliophthora roreri MCA 2997]
MSDAPYVANGEAAAALPKPSRPLDPLGIQQKYEEERSKRLRPEGTHQFVELRDSDKYRHLGEDIWVDHTALNAQKSPLEDGASIKALVLGAGYGGLFFAVRLIQAGFSPNDIRLVDSAGGFGGTWYWNRYPGLMCDVESYCYMPLLEETGYMPKHKYAYGPELLQHANRIAEKWDLKDKALFHSEVKTLDWDESGKSWVVKIEEYRRPNEEKKGLTVRAQFIFLAFGVLNFPHIPKIPSMEQFKGHMFHTSRWDYAYTGGSPDDWTMSNLKEKRVGIIGTGATAVQVVPQLAEWVKELYVLQRTPSSVDVRGQRETDPLVWKNEIAAKKGWQRERQLNLASYSSNTPNGPNMVNDGWTTSPAYSAIIGGTKYGVITPDKIPEFVGNMFALDMERAHRIRTRVDEVVKDPTTAEKLKPWYPVWCKRPCFHDDYLPTFNKSNVHLVDTDGKGVERFTENGIVANGKEYPIDVLILSTGYRSLGGGSGSPAYRADLVIHGRNGLDMEEKWAGGIATLHGVFTRDFPNLFFPGISQAAATTNQIFTLDVLTEHIAFIISETLNKGRAAEPTKEAEEQWSVDIMTRTAALAAVAGCTPSYLNSEGEISKLAQAPVEVQMRAARAATWGEGIMSYMEKIGQWRANGLEGVEFSA